MSEKMIFCLGDGKYELSGDGYQKHLRIFNKDVSEARYDEVKELLLENEIKVVLTKWTDYDKLEKSEQTTTAKQLGGLLKVFSYEDAWLNFWNEATQSQKNCILDLPEFDAAIFKEITDIDCSKQDDATTEAIELLRKNGYEIVKKGE
jgi:hypothetical protein